MWKRLRQILPQILLAGIVLAASIYIALAPTGSLLNWYNNDDGFYYFRVAQRIVAGQGVTFDGINPTNGFHPLWMVICVAVYAFSGKDLILPLRVVVIIFGLFNAGSALLIYQILKKKLSPWVGWLLAFGFSSSWIVFNNTFTGGLESALSCFMTIWVWYLIVRFKEAPSHSYKDLVFIGIATGLTVLSRLDNLILIGLLGLWVAFANIEDSAFLLTDFLTGLAITLLAAIARVGYDIYPLGRELLVMVVLLAAGLVVGNYLLGFYSWPNTVLDKAWWFRGGAVWVFVNLLLWGGSFVLYRAGFIHVFARSILGVAGGFTLVYCVFIRPWVSTRVFKTNDHLSKINLTEAWNGFKTPLAYFLPIIVLLGGYMLWSQINFHTPVPVSGQIKQWWSTLGMTMYGSPISTQKGLTAYLFGNGSPFDFLYAIPGADYLIQKLGYPSGGYILWLLIGAAYLVIMLSRKGFAAAFRSDQLAVFPFVAATIFRILYFYITGYVHMRSWYWTVETFTVFLLLAGIVIAIAGRIKASKIASLATGLILLGAVAIQALHTGQTIGIVYPRDEQTNANHDYLVIPQQLADATPSGAIIGTPGGGAISYFIPNRTIVNLDGLMNSKEYFDALKNSTTNSMDQKSGITYIFGSDFSLKVSAPYARIFKGHLTLISEVGNKSLYQYHSDISQ
jgi:hypothetical protein